MGLPPRASQPLTLDLLHRLLDPGRVFYRVAVRDTLERGERAEIEALLQGARDVKQEFGGLDGLISHLESAAKKAR
jgi:hypothetical protein